MKGHEVNELESNSGVIVITQYEALKADIEIMKQEDEKASFDYRDPKQNKLARSHVYSMRQLKSKIETARKDAKSYALEYGRRVDSLAKELAGEIDALMLPHKTEIEKIEEEERQRVEGHKEKIARLIWLRNTAGLSAAEIADRLAEVKAFDSSGLEEFKPEADDTALATIRILETAHAAQVKLEAEAAELLRLRQEAAEREEADRIRRIKEEAIQAERKAAAEAEAKRKEEEERQRLEAERRHQQEIEEAKRRELESQLAAERAAREKAEAEKRAAEAEERMRAEKERQERLAKEQEEEAARYVEERRRMREEIIAEIAEALGAYKNTKDMATAIVDGLVKHVRI